MWKSAAGKTASWLALLLSMAACSVWSSSDSGLTNEARGATPDGPEVSPTATLIPLAAFPDLGPAPEIENEVWLNTDRPLRLAEQVGKVVLIEFWTYG